MSLRPFDMASAFAALKAGGCKPPADFETDEGLGFALEVWLAVLSDLDGRSELLELVVLYLRRPGSRWWPTPGQLLELRAAPADDALECWALFLAMVRKYGKSAPPVRLSALESSLQQHGTFEKEAGRPLYPIPWAMGENELQDAAMWAGLEALGGWRAACAMRENDAPSRATFRDAYRARAARLSWGGEVEAVKKIAAAKLPPSLQIGGAS